MDDAREAITRGECHWTVCMAGHQSGGRGRVHGRRWEDGGKSLLFTAIIERKQLKNEYPLTQLLALGLCRYLESTLQLKPTIKWPNDVLLDGRKIAGILVEQEKEYLLAGMGLNLSQTVFPENLRRPAVSLGMLLSDDTDTPLPKNILIHLLNGLEDMLTKPPRIEEISRRLDQSGKTVSVLLGDPSRDESVEGRVEGLGNDGALLIRLDGGNLRSIYSGELN